METNRKIWQCQVCKKEFAKINQSHKCEVVDVNTLFYNKGADLFDLYEYLLSNLKKIGGWTVTTSKKAITIYAESKIAFVGIEIRKSSIDIWFVLNRRIEEFPIYKIEQPSKNKFGHFLRLQTKGDIDKVLIKWIKESYDFVNNKNMAK